MNSLHLKDLNAIFDEIVGINPESRTVEAQKGKYNYDWLIIATGCRIAPEDTDGLEDWKPAPILSPPGPGFYPVFS